MKFVKPLVAIATLSAIASPLFLSSAASAEIIIRPFARREVIIAPRYPVIPVVSRPVIVESPSVVSQPVFQSSESYNLERRDGWVDSNLAVNRSGRELLLNVDGQAQFDYAEVKFGDGQVERVNLRNRTYSNGEYPILSFGHNRYVNAVHLLSRSESSRSHISLDLQS